MAGDEQKRYYDHEPAYRRLKESGKDGWESAPDSTATQYDQLIAFLDSEHCPAPGLALELGCGGGQASIILAEHGWNVVGIEYSVTGAQMADANARTHDAALRVIVGDVMQKLPLHPESFDLVIDNHVLHCAVGDQDRGQFLCNVHDALKVGGVYFGTNMSDGGNVDYERLNIDPATRTAKSGTRYLVRAHEHREELEKATLNILVFDVLPGDPDDYGIDDITVYARK